MENNLRKQWRLGKTSNKAPWRNWHTRQVQALLIIPGSNPGGATTGSIESGAYWVKRFGKSERRLTAGQTALICYSGATGETHSA